MSWDCECWYFHQTAPPGPIRWRCSNMKSVPQCKIPTPRSRLKGAHFENFKFIPMWSCWLVFWRNVPLRAEVPLIFLSNGLPGVYYTPKRQLRGVKYTRESTFSGVSDTTGKKLLKVTPWCKIYRAVAICGVSYTAK